MMAKEKAMIEMAQKNSEVRARHIEKILAAVKKPSSVDFPNVSAVTKYIANKLEEIEGSPVADSTIRRNPIYRSMADDFFNGVQKNSGVPSKESKNLALQLKVRELQRENKALSASLESAYSKLSLQDYAIDQEVIDQHVGEKKSAIDANKFYEILSRLINEDLGLAVDRERKIIIDEVTEHIYIKNEELPGFFEWWEEKS